MNNYPDGFSGKAENYTADYTCPYCGKQWEVAHTRELGYDGPVSYDDVYCPECGMEGEVK